MLEANNAAQAAQIRGSEWFGALMFGLLSAAGAALSLAVTGYVFGVNNNLFHLPIVAALYDEPQFQDDAFIQSLRYFAAGPWLILAGSEKIIAPYWSFFGLLFLSRWIAFIGFLACATLLEIRTAFERSIFVLLLAFTSIMLGYSLAGAGGLFISYFTHSEIAIGFTLLSFFFAIQGRIVAAMLFNGIVFFCNAFIAVWDAVPLALIVVALLLRGDIRPKDLVLRGLVGAVILLAIASPVLRNIWLNPEFGKPLSFDFRELLERRANMHALFSLVRLDQMAGLAVVTLTGLMAFRAIGPKGRLFSLGIIGYLLVYAAGIAAPRLTSAPNILNLNLLRSSTGIHLLAALGAASLTTLWLTRGDTLRTRTLGPLLALSIATVKPALVFALPVIGAAIVPTFSRHLDALRLHRAKLLYAAIVVLVVFWPWRIWDNFRDNRIATEHVGEWRAIGEWARTNTKPEAVFLIPSFSEIGRNSGVFEYTSHRRVWVDYKRGAAAFWTPSYYEVWWPRMSEVMRLQTIPDQIAYGQQHRINYIIDECNKQAGQPAPVFRTDRLCVWTAAP